MCEGLETWKAMGAVSGISCQAIPLAEAYGQVGREAQGLALVNETLALVEGNGERLFEAELLRVKGGLLQQLGKATEAETCIQQAIAVAHQQGAKMWELRSTISLYRLAQHQGRANETHAALKALCDRFTEGFDTPDLQEARTLL